uniref:Secreted protein n=1 Tax=Ditylenchus dipsaci TaxID=166011 RepID=A0A915E8N2_9BILA
MITAQEIIEAILCIILPPVAIFFHARDCNIHRSISLICKKTCLHIFFVTEKVLILLTNRRQQHHKQSGLPRLKQVWLDDGGEPFFFATHKNLQLIIISIDLHTFDETNLFEILR